MGRSSVRGLSVLIGIAVAIVGLASPSSAHHNTVVGSVTCRTDGGWAVTWKITNSEADKAEQIIESNRTWAVPVGTVIAAGKTGTYTEAVTIKPTSDVTLTVKGKWSNGVTAQNSGTIARTSFSDACATKTVQPPTVPVTDACGPGNATYGEVPAGPWTVVRNADGSVVITTTPGNVFSNGQTTITLPVPVDSNQACATTPTPTPAPTPTPTPTPTVTPTTPIQVESAIAVRANVKKIDKCGRAGDVYKPIWRPGVQYSVNGTKVPAGKWLHADSRVVKITATSVKSGVSLLGKRSWTITYRTARCGQAPNQTPHTGA